MEDVVESKTRVCGLRHYAVLALTRIINSVVTGQAPFSLE